MSVEKSLPREVEVAVTIFGEPRKLKVEKLPLGRAAQLSRVFSAVPARVASLRDNDEVRAAWERAAAGDTSVMDLGAQLVGILPELLETASDVVLDILEVGTGLPREELEQLGLDEATEILLAIFTVNNVSRVVQNAKNLWGLLSGGTQTQGQNPKIAPKTKK